MDPEALFREHLTLIAQRAEAVCRRSGVTGQDAEDFVSEVCLKLLEDDYAVVRKFRGLSTFPTYLTSVIGNLFRDARIRRDGKYRPSAEAMRLGDLAVRLEKLIHRDHHSFEDALALLQQSAKTPLRRADVVQLHKQLPLRSPLRSAQTEDPDTIPSPEEADTAITDAEREAKLVAAKEALRRALEGLPDEDRVIIRLLYLQRMKVSEVAAALGLPQAPLYARLQRLYLTLRKRLLREGVSGDIIDFFSSP